MKRGKIMLFIKEPWRIVVSAKTKKFTKWLPDAFYLKCMYRTYFNQKLSLDKPRSFNEKLQWLKLHDRKEIYTTMVDKYAMKKYAAERIGEEHIPKLLGVWKTFDQINFENLPNRFVLKCTHDSSSVIICKDMESFDFIAAKQKLESCLKKNHYYAGREWQYKNVPPRIMAEEYLEDDTYKELRDYKFFTFHGVPRVMHLVSNRQNEKEETYGDFFDMDFNHLDLTVGHDNKPTLPEKPLNFELMKKYAELLAKGTTHLRVDFYEVNGRLYLGELTFYENSGFIEIDPPKWNDILGEWIDLKQFVR